MSKHRANRQTLEIVTVATCIAVAVVLCIAAINGFGGHEPDRHAVPQSSVGSLVNCYSEEAN